MAWLALVAEPAWVTIYLATLQSLQVLLLAWIGSEQHASSKERERRRAAERHQR